MEKIKDINLGDALTFRAWDGNYKLLLCTSVHKKKSPHYYIFAGLTFSSFNKPVLKDVLESYFYGTGNTKSDYFKYNDDELDRMWGVHPEVKPYYLGSYGLMILRKDFLSFRSDIEYVVNVSIPTQLEMHGNGSMNISSFSFINELFSNDNLDEIMGKRFQKAFKITAISK